MATEPILHHGADINRTQAVRIRSVRHPAQMTDLLSRAWFKKLLFLSADVVAIVSAHHLAQILALRWIKMPATSLDPRGYYLFYIPFFTALLYLFEGYKSLELRRPEKELELVFKSISVSFVGLTCANFVFFKSLIFSRYIVLEWYVLTLIFVLMARFSLRATYAVLWRRGFARQKAILLGSAKGLADLQRRLSIQQHRGYDLLGVLMGPDEGPITKGIRRSQPSLLGSLVNWEEIAESEAARLVVVHLEDSADTCNRSVLEIVRRCHEKGIEVAIYSTIFGAAEVRYERDEFSGYFRFYTPPRWSRAIQRAAKASLDVLIGLAGSVVTLLLIPFIGLLLKWEDGGAIFHRREYIGTDGQVHHFLKFRTMVEDAEVILQNDVALQAEFNCSFKLKNDPRVLRVGRFLRKYSLDEFPQFFSVLTGQLTFVGPRAITPEACERYGELLPKLLSMKPGLTGFWQVMGRQTTSYEDKIQMDMFYVDQWSIWLDFVIIAKTFWEVARAKGAY
jgi:exopolysaccharide biosynthesis polyprenyl glycosylphosphotransferase